MISTDRWLEDEGYAPQRDTVYTGLVLLAIPLALVAIHLFVPATKRSALVFEHSQFRFYTLWTSSFVHADWPHLLNNLVGYSFAVVILFVIAYDRNNQGGVRNTILTFLIVLPPLISSFDYIVFRYAFSATESAATRGFSGVAAGIFGLLFVLTVREVDHFTETRKDTIHYVLTVVLLCLSGIVFHGGIGTVTIYGALVIGVVLAVSPFVPRNIFSKQTLENLITKRRLQILWATLTIVSFVPILFPVEWIGEEQVTNIFGHASGIFLGCTIGGGFVLWSDSWAIETTTE